MLTYLSPKISTSEGRKKTHIHTLRNKKQRHEIRRKLRNVASDPRVGELYITTDLDELAADVDAFINMMAQDTKK